MAAAISNWRILEADIVDCLQHQRLKITRDNFGNPHCGTINIAELALELTEHGVMVTATPVAVTAQGGADLKQRTRRSDIGSIYWAVSATSGCGSPTMIAGSLSNCIDGFRQS